jgi:hypothetical protein
LSKTVTTEDQVETAVGGVTFDTLYQSELDRRANEASQTAVQNYEKKHKLKDGKSVEVEPKPDPTPDPKKKGDEDGKEEKIPSWAKALTENVTKLSDTVSGIVQSQQTASKQSQATELLKNSKVPEKYQKKWINRINVDDEETSLEDQVKALEAEYLEMKQEFVNKSVEDGDLGGGTGGETGEGDMNEFLDDKFGASAEPASKK